MVEGIVLREQRSRLSHDRERVRVAVGQLHETLRELTPAGQVRSRPFAFVVGGFVLGLWFGVNWGRSS